MSIPRSVFQTWPSSDLPEPLARNLRHNQEWAAGWTFRVFSDGDAEAFIKSEYGGEMLSTYRMISPSYGAARADVFRYLLIYRCGGVYVDMKAQFTQELSRVIRTDDEYLLGRWAGCGEPQYESFGRHAEIPGAVGEFQQWYLVARPGHPYLKAVISQVVSNIKGYLPSVHGVGRGGALRTTGPIAYTNAILPIQASHPHRMVRSYSDLGFRYSCLPAGDGHHQLFRKHYSQVTEPVVKMDARRVALDLSARMVIRFRRIWSRSA